MKKKINPTTGKEEYRCNYSEAADSMKPKLTYLHGIAGFWLSDLEHYKKNNIGEVRRNKKKVAEKTVTAEVIDLSKKKRT